MISEGWQISVKITHPHRFCMKPELAYYYLALKEKTGKNFNLTLFFSSHPPTAPSVSQGNPPCLLHDYTHTHTHTHTHALFHLRSKFSPNE